MYFRFFVGDDDYCRTIQVAAEAEYGAPILTLSNIDPHPSDKNFGEYEVLNTQDTFAYAQAVIWLCPNANQLYDRGTYAVGVTAGTPTSFSLVVTASTQTLPIPEPEVRVNCSDVPPEEFIYGNRSFCAEDSLTLFLNEVIIFVISQNCIDILQSLFYYDIILPVTPGCHSISVALTVVTKYVKSSFDLFCLPLQSDNSYMILGRFVSLKPVICF